MANPEAIDERTLHVANLKCDVSKGAIRASMMALGGAMGFHSRMGPLKGSGPKSNMGPCGQDMAASLHNC